jgi:hypothetical protein
MILHALLNKMIQAVEAFCCLHSVCSCEELKASAETVTEQPTRVIHNLIHTVLQQEAPTLIMNCNG